jgi:RNA polymerase sigma-70 factor (ECF subfamily)
LHSHASRLSSIDTPWSVVLKAHRGSDDTVRAAQQTLLNRYGGAVRRYLRVCLRDEEAAGELFQEFALRLVRGDFRAADPQRGRFRSFVKSALFHLIVDFRRRQAKKGRPLADDPSAGPTAAADSIEEELFVQSWRDELFCRTWETLREAEQHSSTPYYSALRLLVDNPELTSAEIAEQLSLPDQPPLAAGNVRVVLHRARQIFADRLIEEVADSLEIAAAAEVEQELVDLNLLEYCRAALARWKHAAGQSPDGIGRRLPAVVAVGDRGL